MSLYNNLVLNLIISGIPSIPNPNFSKDNKGW